jgi:hypothetical protein
MLAFSDTHAIADTGATSIFVMTGTPMKNIRPATEPLTINLPNGDIVHSTHICDISIPGLPMILTGHIVPGLSMASLMGIRVLCKAGCKVIFTDTKCKVRFNNKIILNGIKDPTIDLWTLPITPTAINETGSYDPDPTVTLPVGPGGAYSYAYPNPLGDAYSYAYPGGAYSYAYGKYISGLIQHIRDGSNAQSKIARAR